MHCGHGLYGVRVELELFFLLGFAPPLSDFAGYQQIDDARYQPELS